MGIDFKNMHVGWIIPCSLHKVNKVYTCLPSLVSWEN